MLTVAVYQLARKRPQTRQPHIRQNPIDHRQPAEQHRLIHRQPPTPPRTQHRLPGTAQLQLRRPMPPAPGALRTGNRRRLPHKQQEKRFPPPPRNVRRHRGRTSPLVPMRERTEPTNRNRRLRRRIEPVYLARHVEPLPVPRIPDATGRNQKFHPQPITAPLRTQHKKGLFHAHTPRKPQPLPRQLDRDKLPHQIRAGKGHLRRLRSRPRPTPPRNRIKSNPNHRTPRPLPGELRRRQPESLLPKMPQRPRRPTPGPNATYQTRQSQRTTVSYTRRKPSP